MLHISLLTLLALLVSFIKDRKKTYAGIRVSLKKLRMILPAILTMLVFISIVLYLVPDEMIIRHLGGANIYTGTLAASVIGSIILMPGFVAFPLCGILLGKGVSYMVLSAFTTTLMKVGILTYPLEKEYFGARVTIVRNVLSYITAMVVAALPLMP